MKSNLSSQDWLKLSAYLDRQLSSRELARLEERLQNEPELRNTLDDLRQMQTVLRRHSTLRAPRNFTVTHEMVGAHRRTPPYPVFRLATALATLVLVLMFVGELISQRAGAPAAAPRQIQESLAFESAPAGEAEALSEFAPESAAAGDAQPLEMAPMVAAEAPTEAAAVAAVEAPEGTPPPSAKMVAPPTTGQEATEAAPSESQMQLFSAPEAVATAEEQTAPKIFGVERNLWHGLEAILAVIALAAGVSWLILRRRA